MTSVDNEQHNSASDGEAEPQSESGKAKRTRSNLIEIKLLGDGILRVPAPTGVELVYLVVGYVASHYVEPLLPLL